MSSAEFQPQPLEHENIAKGDATSQFPSTADVVKPGDTPAADAQGRILSPKDYAASINSLQQTKPSEIWSDPKTCQRFHSDLNNVVATAIDSGDTARMTQVQDILQAHIGQATKFVTGDRPALIGKLDEEITRDLSTNTSA